MNESLRQRALTLIHMESNPSKEEWIELVRELLKELEETDRELEYLVENG